VNPLRSLSQSSSFSLCRFWMSALFCRFNGSYEAAYRSCAMRDQTRSHARHTDTCAYSREGEPARTGDPLPPKERSGVVDTAARAARASSSSSSASSCPQSSRIARAIAFTSLPSSACGVCERASQTTWFMAVLVRSRPDEGEENERGEECVVPRESVLG
jgi:hypothetical protein